MHTHGNGNGKGNWDAQQPAGYDVLREAEAVAWATLAAATRSRTLPQRRKGESAADWVARVDASLTQWQAEVWRRNAERFPGESHSDHYRRTAANGETYRRAAALRPRLVPFASAYSVREAIHAAGLFARAESCAM